ncbi:MAG: NCS2 family permease [Nitrospinota bacterium]
MTKMDLPLFTRGDIDGFFGLLIDNLMQLLVISTLTTLLCGVPLSIVLGTILPSAAASILLGNLFYTIQARRLAKKTGNPNVTALPYGINTVSLFAFLFFIMAPVYRATGDWKASYALGLAACFFSGIIETFGAMIAEKIRKFTPRAALLSTLSGIAIGFISMDFILRIYHRPAMALLPLGIVLVQYFGKVSLPYQIPAGFLAILTGTALSWLPVPGIGFMTWPVQEEVSMEWILTFPLLINTLFSVEIWDYMSIIVPMGLFNIIGSLQNIESASAGGDDFETSTSLAVNGAGTVFASLLGSCFPTTIYIGHPGWKALGARQGYSALNGLIISALCVFGVMKYVLLIIPVEAGAPIVFWIAIVITAQAFQATDAKHAPAVAIGLIPGIVAWGVFLIDQTLVATGTFSLFNLGLEKFANTGLAAIDGLLKLERGFMLTCTIWAAMSVQIIDKNFKQAASWAAIATSLSFFGFIHAYKLTPQGTEYNFGVLATPYVTLGYFFITCYLILIEYSKEKKWIGEY